MVTNAATTFIRGNSADGSSAQFADQNKEIVPEMGSPWEPNPVSVPVIAPLSIGEDALDRTVASCIKKAMLRVGKGTKKVKKGKKDGNLEGNLEGEEDPEAGEQYLRELVKTATREALVAIGADIRKGYESEAGRLTTQVADLDGHIVLLRSDVFHFKSGLTGREEKLNTLVGSSVEELERATKAVEKQHETTAKAQSDFQEAMFTRMAELKELGKDILSAKVVSLLFLGCPFYPSLSSSSSLLSSSSSCNVFHTFCSRVGPSVPVDSKTRDRRRGRSTFRRPTGVDTRLPISLPTRATTTTSYPPTTTTWHPLWNQSPSSTNNNKCTILRLPFTQTVRLCLATTRRRLTGERLLRMKRS